MKSILNFSLIFFLFLFSCKKDSVIDVTTKLPSSHFELVKNSGVDFVNNLTPSVTLSTFSYQYFQNGGGVAIGDFNNDNLQDLFFTSNLEADKLYINAGDLKFKDISASAGISGFKPNAPNTWSTGVTVCDINQDGYLDIYVCKSGQFRKGSNTENLLYINNKDLTFTEMAKTYGINDDGHSTQAVFFDYDKDGDLDLFVLNHSILFGNPSKAYNISLDINEARSHSCSLYRNDGQSFEDVSKEAGVVKFAYGLGLVASDINNDGWVDLYVANDFSRPDFMFINNGNGTFTDKVKESTGHLSYFSMGCDIADVNNDGMMDINVVDMAPANNFRSKTLMPSMSTENFNTLVDKLNYPHQYMFNSLHINHGDTKFSEIAKLAGVHKTDWSWASLLADFDNDGLKDLFVSNGYKFNKMENDFSIEFKAMKAKYKNKIPNGVKAEWLNKPPSYKLQNQIFKNKNGLEFEKYSKKWNLKEETFSNGAAYADLDNDGDLDLVLNNIDDPAYIYENNSNKNHLQIDLRSSGKPKLADNINSKVEIFYGDKYQVQELCLTRGFQSSVGPIIHFGLGDESQIKRLKVTWADGQVSEMLNIKTNQRIIVDKKDANENTSKKKENTEKFFALAPLTGIDFVHKENQYNDFAKELLLPHKNSQHGPFIAKADVNSDGLEDVFIGGAANQSATLFIQSNDGKFYKSKSAPWATDLSCEDMQAVFFDSDQDEDLDLYVVSGGNEFELGSHYLQDRLYLNDGKGNFTKSFNALPRMNASGSAVVSFDQDNDGDLDLFVAGRMKPGFYPFASDHFILINDNGKFSIDANKSSAFKDLGIITDVITEDIDKDGKQDLLVVGEWSSLHIMLNQGDEFIDSTPKDLLEETGWWSAIEKGDLDGDGDMDFVLGNLGTNYKYQASKEEPFHIYAHDFDQSGSLDIVLGYFNQGVCYPLRGRECSSDQMPFIKEKFPTYKQFASADLKEVYGEDLNKALHREARNFKSSILVNEGNGKFSLKALPLEAQFSCVNSILIEDFDGDAKIDILLSGNLFVAEVETPRNDASVGLFLKGNGKGDFKPMPTKESGFYANKDAKDMVYIKAAEKKLILVTNNNAEAQVFQINNSFKFQ